MSQHSPTRPKVSLIYLAAITGVCVAGLGIAFAYPVAFEKAATRMVMPYGLAWLWITLLLIMALGQDNRRWTLLVAATWTVLYVAGNGWVSLALVSNIERPYIASNPMTEPPFDVVVLLGGSTAVKPNGDVQVKVGGDRIVTAARLYHAGKIRRFVCTGSQIAGLDRGHVDQSEIARRLLISLGVPAEKIALIGGRTTSEEMSSLAKQFRPTDRVGLITSAFHMSRALRLAAAEDFHPSPIPADFYSRPNMKPRWIDAIPNSSSLQVNTVIAKEWLARMVGR